MHVLSTSALASFSWTARCCLFIPHVWVWGRSVRAQGHTQSSLRRFLILNRSISVPPSLQTIHLRTFSSIPISAQRILFDLQMECRDAMCSLSNLNYFNFSKFHEMISQAVFIDLICNTKALFCHLSLRWCSMVWPCTLGAQPLLLVKCTLRDEQLPFPAVLQL